MLNKKVEEALNAQINAEMWSAYLYLSMAAYCHANGNPGMGNWFQVQFQEEQDHAKILFNYIIQRGGHVELKAIDAVPTTWDILKPHLWLTKHKRLKYSKAIYLP